MKTAVIVSALALCVLGHPAPGPHGDQPHGDEAMATEEAAGTTEEQVATDEAPVDDEEAEVEEEADANADDNEEEAETPEGEEEEVEGEESADGDATAPVPDAEEEEGSDAGCDSYSVEDYASCITPISPAELPVCEPIHSTLYETKTKTDCEIKTTTITEPVDEVCETTTECVTETSTTTSICDEITETITMASETKSALAGTHTADPQVVHEYHFDYEHQIVHPIVYHTEVEWVEPPMETSIVQEPVKVTQTVFETKIAEEVVTIKETPTVTETMYDGCEEQEYYHTEYPEPVVEEVRKTIYVPVGCAQDEDICKTDVEVEEPGYPDNSPAGSTPGYGATEPAEPAEPVEDDGEVVEDEGYGSTEPAEPVVDDSYGATEPAGSPEPAVQKPGYGGSADAEEEYTGELGY